MNTRYIIFVIFSLLIFTTHAQNNEMVKVGKGEYIPLYGRDSSKIKVASFLLDTVPVTKTDFLKFISNNPKWQKKNIKGIFADKHYLKDWKNKLYSGEANQPVTNISWFAAKAYCECQDKRLPTLDEWEYAAMADKTKADARKKKDYNQFILDWYERPKKSSQIVGSTFKNYWGVYDLHGLVWEWTADFNSVLISSESRNGGKNNNLFCSAAAVGATDLMNYAAFMRYAFRSSLKGNYNINNLGFRCAKDLKKK